MFLDIDMPLIYHIKSFKKECKHASDNNFLFFFLWRFRSLQNAVPKYESYIEGCTEISVTRLIEQKLLDQNS